MSALNQAIHPQRYSRVAPLLRHEQARYEPRAVVRVVDLQTLDLHRLTVRHQMEREAEAKA